MVNMSEMTVSVLRHSRGGCSQW